MRTRFQRRVNKHELSTYTFVDPVKILFSALMLALYLVTILLWGNLDEMITLRGNIQQFFFYSFGLHFTFCAASNWLIGIQGPGNTVYFVINPFRTPICKKNYSLFKRLLPYLIYLGVIAAFYFVLVPLVFKLRQ